MGDASDWELLARARRGDDSAFEVLVERHSAMLFRSAVYRLGDEHAARDAVAEAFALLWHKRDALAQHSSGSVRPWLLGVVRNICLATSRARAQVVLTDESALLDSAEEGHEAWFVATTWRYEVLSRALAAIADDYRECVLMRFIDELGYDEIARHLGLTQGAVRTRVSRGLAAMRAAVADIDASVGDA